MPGPSDTSSGIPFSGSGGNLLAELLANAGIMRDQCLCGFLVSQRVFQPRYTKQATGLSRPAPWFEAELDRVQEQLKATKPNIIIALGQGPLSALMGGTRRLPLDKWRGSVLESPFGKLIATYAPEDLFKTYSFRTLVENDLKRALEESLSPKLSRTQKTLVINPSLSDTLQYLDSAPRKVAFDIETSGRRTRCIALSTSPNHAFCIPFMSKGRTPQHGTTIHFGPTYETFASHWSYSEELEILRRLHKLFANPEVELIAQNFPFDSEILGRDFGFSFANLWMDTMVAQHCCYSELPKALDFLSSMYTKNPYHKSYDVASDLSTWEYNAMDACVTFEVAQRLEAEMKELEVYDFYRELAQPTMAYRRNRKRD